MNDRLPPSPEVLSEEFYDVCAFVRDLDLEGAPPFFNLVLKFTMPLPTTYIDKATEEIVEETLDWMVEVQRYPDGALHVHGPHVCADLDPVLLAEKRPVKS